MYPATGARCSARSDTERGDMIDIITNVIIVSFARFF